MSRLKIVHYRVDDINDPKIANVALGELFNDVSGNVFYKRHDNGNIIQVTNVSGLNSLPWSGITGKPTTSYLNIHTASVVDILIPVYKTVLFTKVGSKWTIEGL